MSTITGGKFREVYSIAEACEDCAEELREGSDYSPTTIRCTLNDLLDWAEKNGMRVRHNYNQPLAVKRVRQLLEAIP